MSEYKYWIFAIILVISFVVVAFLCVIKDAENRYKFGCLLYTSPSPRD